MPAAPIPENEAARLAALRAYEALDSNWEDGLGGVTELACRLLRVPAAQVSLIEADTQFARAQRGVDLPRLPRADSFCAHAILDPEGRPLVVRDAQADTRFADNPLVTGEAGLRFYMGMPLVNPDGYALGTLCVCDQQPREVPAEDEAALRALARMVVTTLELRRASLRMHAIALTDALTGLPNRMAFRTSADRAVQRAWREAEVFSLLLLDLDGFKGVNDTQGHAAGDAVLRTVGAELVSILRRDDEPCRLGGDEFAAVLARTDLDDARDVAERVRAGIGARLRRDGWPVTASIGTVTFRAPPASASAAIERADLLMYQAKAAGRNRAVSALGDGAAA